jgi:hypothetical protein
MGAGSLANAVAIGEAVERDRTWLSDSLQALGAVFVKEARAQAACDLPRAELAARRHELVQDAIGAIDRNGQAGLVISALVASLRQGRQTRPGKPPPIVITRR